VPATPRTANDNPASQRYGSLASRSATTGSRVLAIRPSSGAKSTRTGAGLATRLTGRLRCFFCLLATFVRRWGAALDVCTAGRGLAGAGGVYVWTEEAGATRRAAGFGLGVTCAGGEEGSGGGASTVVVVGGGTGSSAADATVPDQIAIARMLHTAHVLGTEPRGVDKAAPRAPRSRRSNDLLCRGATVTAPSSPSIVTGLEATTVPYEFQ
jgi:hypothetical protein